MAKEIKVSGNYVIATDLATSEVLGQFPINHCVYRENDNSFIILEQIDNEVVTISKADVDAGEWVDEGALAFTQATLLTFVRENTGFNTASGGSGAPSLNVRGYFDVVPSIVEEINNTLGLTSVNIIRDGVGLYTLEWNEELTNTRKMQMFIDTNSFGVASVTTYLGTGVGLKFTDFTGTPVDPRGNYELKLEYYG